MHEARQHAALLTNGWALCPAWFPKFLTPRNTLCTLTEESAKVDLHFNVKKTKLLTNDARWQHHDTPCFVETHWGMLEVLPNTFAHKYMGRHICGHSQNRGETELNHRIAQAWGKFHKHRQTLLNRNVPIGLRFELFDSMVNPQFYTAWKCSL